MAGLAQAVSQLVARADVLELLDGAHRKQQFADVIWSQTLAELVLGIQIIGGMPMFCFRGFR